MKKLLILLLFISSFAYAQVTPGPSDIKSPPPLPKSNITVGKVVCTGQPITLNNDTASYPGFTFTWYKLAQDGTKKTSVITTSLYTETATETGWYIYQVIASNPKDGSCPSPISDPFKVYVAPALSVTVTSPLASTCAVTGNSIILTANVPTGFAYIYQWQRNGVNIAGATASTYTVSGESTAANITFSCNVSYDWGLVAPGNTACTASASKVITIVNAPAKPVIR